MIDFKSVTKAYLELDVLLPGSPFDKTRKRYMVGQFKVGKDDN